jgi:hypothetical protein
VKRLEIIHLRLAGALPPGLLDEIRQSTMPTKESTSVDLYCRVNVENDVAIHLHLRESGPEDQASDLGVRLAAALKEYGMVEHTVWRDATPTPAKEGEGDTDPAPTVPGMPPRGTGHRSQIHRRLGAETVEVREATSGHSRRRSDEG